MHSNDAVEAAVALLAGRYRLGPRIGRGGMADVFRAEDTVLHRSVAVKVFRTDSAGPGEQRRIDTEVRMLASLSHPGLVTIFDAGTSGDPDESPFLIMELVTGPNLAHRLTRGPFSLEETASFGARLAGTLAYIHGRGIVHRDIKPANILFQAEAGPASATPKLADFGIARLIDSTRITLDGTLIGTPNYLSPEQAEGQPGGTASDVYALGLVLIECLAGRPAFPGSGVEAAIARLHHPPSLPSGLDAGWSALLTAMTAREPSHRPAAADLGVHLAGLVSTTPRRPVSPPVSQTGVLPEPLVPAPRTRHRRRRHRWPAAVTAGLGVGTCAVLAAVTLSRPGASTPPRPPAITAPAPSPHPAAAATAAPGSVASARPTPVVTYERAASAVVGPASTVVGPASSRPITGPSDTEKGGPKKSKPGHGRGPRG